MLYGRSFYTLLLGSTRGVILVEGSHESSCQRAYNGSEPRRSAMTEKNGRTSNVLEGQAIVVIPSEETIEKRLKNNRIGDGLHRGSQPTQTSIKCTSGDTTFPLVDDQPDRWGVLGFEDKDFLVSEGDKPTVEKSSVMCGRVTKR